MVDAYKYGQVNGPPPGSGISPVNGQSQMNGMPQTGGLQQLQSQAQAQQPQHQQQQRSLPQFPQHPQPQHMLQPQMHPVVPVPQLPNIQHMLHTLSSPYPEISKTPILYQQLQHPQAQAQNLQPQQQVHQSHLQLHMQSQNPYNSKLEMDMSGYPMISTGPNILVYATYPQEPAQEREIAKMDGRTNFSGTTFIASKQSQLANNLPPHPDDNKQQALLLEDKPHVCSHEGCKWAFARFSDLKRHAKSHKKPTFHCPYWKVDPTCHRNGGSFNRLDVLKRHLRLVHYVKDKQLAYASSDHGWCRACQKLFLSSKSFIDHCQECSIQVANGEVREGTPSEGGKEENLETTNEQ